MSKKEEERDPEEIARRMERGLKRAFEKPPQPHGRNPTTSPKRRIHPAKPAEPKP